MYKNICVLVNIYFSFNGFKSFTYFWSDHKKGTFSPKVPFELVTSHSRLERICAIVLYFDLTKKAQERRGLKFQHFGFMIGRLGVST